MDYPEIKVGQKYRVVDAEGFGYADVAQGDVLEVFTRELIEDDDHYYGISEDEIIITHSEIVEGIVELVEEPTEPSEDVLESPHSDTPKNTENVSQASTGSPTAIQSGLSAELLWKFIEGASVYNGHKQFEIKELPWDVLKESVRVLGEYLETDEDTLASSLEIRLMYNGDSGKFAGTWSASVCQLDYWSDGEHRDGHEDRLLFGVEIVKGI